jgi:hypothetical protein
VFSIPVPIRVFELPRYGAVVVRALAWNLALGGPGLSARDQSVRVSPNLNALVERWVRAVKQECLSKLILIGEGPLSRTLAEFSAHYNRERNHRGKGDKLLFPGGGTTIPRRHAVECRQRLGGLRKFYGRAA